jgi:hypothetical protein
MLDKEFIKLLDEKKSRPVTKKSGSEISARMHQKSPKLDCLERLSKVPNLTAHTENLTLRGIEF